MKILALDLSTRKGSVALCRAGAPPARLGGARQAERPPYKPLAQRQWANDRRNSASFFRALEEIVRAHGGPERVVVGLGPGSYTGTRIAISAGIGLEVTSGAQLCGIPSICAISTEEDFVVIGDARRGSFFLARILHGAVAGEIELLSSKEMAQRISETAVSIYTSDDLPQFSRARLSYPRAELLCRLAEDSQNLVRAPLTPIYLRAPHITAPRALCI